VSTTTSKLTQPVLAGGAVMGVLSALPVVSAGNICCCLWIISGGLAASFIFQQNQQEPMTAADGALVGLLAGIVGAFIYLAISIPVTILLAPMERAFIDRLSEMSGSMPPEFRSYMTSSIGSGLRLIFGFMLMLFCGSVFSTLGGLLGAAIFRKKPSQPQVIDVPPSS
jgi:hypothetical protein